MLWINVLENWKNGIPFRYPKNLNGRFQWNTSVLKNNGNVPYRQAFKVDNNLAQVQSLDEFERHFRNSKNKYVVAFPNLSGDTMLVCPMPMNSKNYATLKDFIDNASITQQKMFWKKVAITIKQFMKTHNNVWVSVHGLGVDYTHVRISSSPKYYFDIKKI
jgi:hypothetical protein